MEARRTTYERDFERYTTHIEVDRANYILVMSTKEQDSKDRAELIVKAMNNFERIKALLEEIQLHVGCQEYSYELSYTQFQELESLLKELNP